MKALITLLVLCSTTAFARDTYVRGHVRSDGTYVQGHHRTTADDTVNNNYGTSGNLNPYTGETGKVHRNPYQGNGDYNTGNGLGGTPSYDYGSDND